ncbi:MAG: hypothetical protein KHZ58_12330 [Hungatella hathewayi]|nr:hypothetical protein [Hungatella hathewayi]
MQSRDELLQSIRPGMRLDKAFFLRVYGYEISYPGFAEQAMDKLEGLYIIYAQRDTRHPRELYREVVRESETRRDSGMKEAAEWYVKQLNEKWERKVKKAIAGNRESRYQFTGFPENW